MIPQASSESGELLSLLVSCAVLAVSICLHYTDFWTRVLHRTSEKDGDGKAKTSSSRSSSSSSNNNKLLDDKQPLAFTFKSRRKSLPVAAPVHTGVPLQSLRLDCLSLCRYMPENAFVIIPKPKRDPPDSPDEQSPMSPSYVTATQDPQAQTESMATNNRQDKSRGSLSSRSTISRASLRQSLSWAQQAHQNKTKAEALTMSKLPFLPGCEPEGKAAKEMQAQFPGTPLPDIVRFLVARKGDAKAAAEMLTKAQEWHQTNFPLSGDKRKQVEAAFSANCFFTHGTARDGTPVLYMRGALYDGSKASPEAYVLAAAHAISHALANSTEINVTVVVHAVNVPGAPNDNADLTFIKGFISVLSDNFPERLKRLAIFPFPWYGRAIWSVLKVFVDKRTQNKVMLLSGDGTSIPLELQEFLDPNAMPVCCGGSNTDKVLDMRTTL